ncbi:hypothetical protein [Propionispora hippei]|uniref:Uncharacterized protein n=1 Tax=Propionispora hippei DSM 15287 TaxID=1123003 RepID=A0A1M6ECK5_9FIRM|nr:hypothetical protein [Propionispora hippei]SHI83237.1 hypothetical protein SAMN02745170_01148 [Propionispora hippei DSM 15287]
MGLLYDLTIEAARRSRSLQEQQAQLPPQENKDNSKQSRIAAENGSCRKSDKKAIPAKINGWVSFGK